MLIGRVALLVALSAVTACSHSGSAGGPTLPVQTLCGKVISREVAFDPVNLFHAQEQALVAGGPTFLVFDPTCHGVRVQPDPARLLSTSMWGEVAQVRGSGGLVGGLYVSQSPQIIHLTITRAGRPPYRVVLRFQAPI